MTTGATNSSPLGTDQTPPSLLHESSRLQRFALSAAWYNLSFRWQILIVVAMASALTWFVAGLLAVIDSRTRATVETSANMDLWQRYILAKAENVSPGWDSENLYEHLSRVFAVRTCRTK